MTKTIMNGTFDNKFSAEKFVDCLLQEGSAIRCDDTVEAFSRSQVPPFYNEKVFKRGQKFFHRHIFALFFAKFLGLITCLSMPSSLKILIHTGMSGTPQTAYKRYMATILHMCVWYDDDFTPGSKMWRSIGTVKNLHNSASKNAARCSVGLNGINQKDMALTQFGFMGYALCRSNQIGIYEDEEELYVFTHVWRVVGYLMGIEDRFNICRESVKETRAICNVLINKVFRPAVARKDKDFFTMADHLAKGMWAMNPILDTNAYLVIMHNFLKPLPSQDNNNACRKNNAKSIQNNNADEFITLTLWERNKLMITYASLYYIRFTYARIFFNYLIYLSLWLMKVCPFLAYYMFGFRDSYVKV